MTYLLESLSPKAAVKSPKLLVSVRGLKRSSASCEEGAVEASDTPDRPNRSFLGAAATCDKQELQLTNSLLTSLMS